jgi:hypothetical protein
MSWNKRQHDETVTQEFRRALHRSAADQAVTEAERTVRELWLAELDHVQEQLKSEYAQVHAARAAAWSAVHERRRAADQPGLALAQEALVKINSDLCHCVAAEHALAQVAAEERELMDLAEEESELIATANRIRLRTAWEGLRAARVKAGHAKQGTSRQPLN